MFLRSISTVILLALFTFPAAAQQTAGPAEEKTSQTSHTIRLDGRDIKYTATTGTLPIRSDEGKVAAQYSYEVVGTEILATPMGKLECTIIDGTARNRLGSARLRSHFHPKYGFVRLDYRNLDDSRILLELTRVTEAKPSVR